MLNDDEGAGVYFSEAAATLTITNCTGTLSLWHAAYITYIYIIIIYIYNIIYIYIYIYGTVSS